MNTIFLSQLNPQNQMPFEKKLLDEANASDKIIILIYSWNKAVISIGKLQRKLNIDYQKTLRDGIEIVQRITGGRAVLHLNDICYSICIPKSQTEKFGKNLSEAIISLSQPIVNTFADFNITAICNDNKHKVLHSNICAQTHSHGEITVRRQDFHKKIAAASQIFSSDGILQHGTIPITDDYLKICDYFYGDNTAAKENLRQRSTFLYELCPDLNIAEFIYKLSHNFKNYLHLFTR